MKIKSMDIKKINLELLKPIKIALGEIKHFETLIIKIETEDGYTGFGESSPVGFVTGETVEVSEEILKRIGSLIVGEDSSSIEKIHGIMDRTFRGNSSSKAAVDIALHDIAAKRAGIPLYKYLGGSKNIFEADKTIPIDTPSKMAEEALSIVKEGFKVIKIKVGLDSKEDIERIRVIRATVGKDIKIRIDANQGWNKEEAIKAINALEAFDIEAVEQPLPFWDIDSHKIIKSKVRIPIMADESLFTPNDAIRLVKTEAFDLFNIKLMKCGGIYNASKINAIGESSGHECMLGCMLESYVGISAGAAFIASKRNMTRADIDSVLYIKPNGIKGGFKFENGMVVMSERPGLGIELDWDKI